jgi:signal transduction histidine kinase
MDRPSPGNPRRFPLVAAPVLTALALAESWLDPTYRVDFAPLAVGAFWIGVGFLVGARFPAAAPVLVALFYPVTAALGGPGPGGAGLIATLLAVGWAGYAVSARASLLGTLGAVLVFLVSDAAVHGGISWDTIFFPAVFFPGRWAGALVRREQQRSAQLVELTAVLDAQREATAHAAVVEERTRIAREVHDAVAHSVSVMTLQVGGLRRQLEDVLVDRPTEREVMLGIERLGRQSVEELRSLVGILRESGTGEPAAVVPSLARAEELVTDVRAAGLPIGLDVVGERVDLPRALDVTAYRILQEALTNVLRHSPGAPTTVCVRYAPDAVEVTVDNDAARVPVAVGAPGVGGHGLVGMQERAAMFGGTLEAGSRESGGYRVHARLPLTGRWR